MNCKQTSLAQLWQVGSTLFARPHALHQTLRLAALNLAYCLKG
jgi:hypothetical protein